MGLQGSLAVGADERELTSLRTPTGYDLYTVLTFGVGWWRRRTRDFNRLLAVGALGTGSGLCIRRGNRLVAAGACEF